MRVCARVWCVSFSIHPHELLKCITRENLRMSTEARNIRTPRPSLFLFVDHRLVFILTGAISLFPLVGSMLGGTQVLINGPCFNSTNLIICDFDGIETSGRLLEDKIALCVSPTFYKIGRIPLSVSLDDGVTFDFTGLFTISTFK